LLSRQTGRRTVNEVQKKEGAKTAFFFFLRLAGHRGKRDNGRNGAGRKRGDSDKNIMTEEVFNSLPLIKGKIGHLKQKQCADSGV